MTLANPTTTVKLWRPEVLEDQDPYEPAAEALGDPLVTDLAATVWFPRGQEADAADQDEVTNVRVLLDPTPGLEPARGDILEDADGQRFRLTWAVKRSGVPELDHTAAGATQVTRRPVTN